MSNKRIYILISLSVMFSLMIMLSYMHFSEVKTVQVDGEIIFNDFIMTKELRTAYENTLNARKSILDSMYISIEQLNQNRSREYDLEGLKMEYLRRKDLYEQQNQELTQKYDEQVWGRIRQYAKEFAAINDYAIVLTTNTTTAVLYANENVNVTKAFLEFMNKKYEGTK